MPLTMTNDPVPLHTDEGGVVRVGETRVTLGQVVRAFRQGATPEEIALRHPGLDLAAVYSAVAYYLNHRDAVDGHLAEEARAADEARGRYAESVAMSALRARLEERRERV